MSYILVIDTGSSSMRGILFDKNGQMCFCEQRTYTMYTEGARAEYDPAVFEKYLLSICRASTDWLDQHNAEIDGLVFTSQRSSIMSITSDKWHPFNFSAEVSFMFQIFRKA